MEGILRSLYRLQTLDLSGPTSGGQQAAELRASIPQGMLASYDRARARGKKSIALVRNHVCTNCRIQVPIAVTASLAAGRSQVCGNCGLYLCLPEPEEQPVAPLPEPSAKAPARRRKSPITKPSASV